MTPAFAEFLAASKRVGPRAAVVLGSGLGAVADRFTVAAAVGFGDIPGLVPPTVAGHRGQVAVGHWDGIPAVVCFGRVHFYEGHPLDRVTGLVRLVADCGVKTLLLTNAAGGIHPALAPGSLMAIRGHLKLLDPQAWRTLAPSQGEGTNPYTPRLLDLVRSLEAAAGRELIAGVYAALTGPSYETPAEIRALQVAGADAVGMSTAIEAEAAAGLGLDVLGISCITNRAAGLSDEVLSHKEVEITAKTAVGRLAEVVGRVLSGAG